MRILVVHNFHRSGAPSGDDAAVKQEIDLLLNNKNKVTLFARYNDTFSKFSIFGKLNTFLHLDFSKLIYKELKLFLKREYFDIIHIHNIFPLITPAVYFTAMENNIPVVHTLHDFRFFCANAFLFRNGEICDLCQTKSTRYSLKYKCFKNSTIGSLFVTRYLEKVKQREYYKMAQIYIALTEFSKNIYRSFGISEENLRVKPNFVVSNVEPSNPEFRNYFLYVGRLSEEKGIKVLINAFKSPKLRELKLKIAGTGPMETELLKMLKEENITNIEFLGFKNRQEILYLMSKAIALIIPSTCLESFPLTLVEAYSVGTPVIASEFGNLGYLVKPYVTGLLFKKGDYNELADIVHNLKGDLRLRAKLSKNSREEYLAYYTPEANYKTLLCIYEQALT